MRDRNGLGLADEILTRRKRNQDDLNSHYVNTQSIVATSNTCESLFSIVLFPVGNSGKRISLARFEEQLILYVNPSLWNISDVLVIFQVSCCPQVLFSTRPFPSKLDWFAVTCFARVLSKIRLHMYCPTVKVFLARKNINVFINFGKLKPFPHLLKIK